MATFLFVHGTGVRRAAYIATFAMLQRAFEEHRIQDSLVPCLWGDDLGAPSPRLAVPGETNIQNARSWSPSEEFARWEILYRDPFFELTLLKNRPVRAEPIPPTAPRPGKALWKRIQAYKPSERALAFLKRSYLEQDWSIAWRDVILKDTTAREILESSIGEIGEPGQAIARAVVARMLQNTVEEARSLPYGPQRDDFVNMLIDDWGARVAGIGTYLTTFFANVASTIATPLVKWKRAELSAAVAPAAGDVLLYQARGSKIRAYIRQQILRLDPPVTVLAHSLGGIASVDLLISEHIPTVKKLITVGSQAPLLHEIGALFSLEPGAKLPSHFPSWLNIYDPYDFLSYIAHPVFPGSDVRDYRVDSGQPFPQAHSAYWSNPDTWSAIRSFL
jgi:hypothetical protein